MMEIKRKWEGDGLRRRRGVRCGSYRLIRP
jgi:hypothetical protein